MSNALAVDVTACPSCGETCSAPASQCVTCFGKALEAHLIQTAKDAVEEQGIGE